MANRQSESTNRSLRNICHKNRTEIADIAGWACLSASIPVAVGTVMILMFVRSKLWRSKPFVVLLVEQTCVDMIIASSEIVVFLFVRYDPEQITFAFNYAWSLFVETVYALSFLLYVLVAFVRLAVALKRTVHIQLARSYLLISAAFIMISTLSVGTALLLLNDFPLLDPVCFAARTRGTTYNTLSDIIEIGSMSCGLLLYTAAIMKVYMNRSSSHYVIERNLFVICVMSFLGQCGAVAVWHMHPNALVFVQHVNAVVRDLLWLLMQDIRSAFAKMFRCKTQTLVHPF